MRPDERQHLSRRPRRGTPRRARSLRSRSQPGSSHEARGRSQQPLPGRRCRNKPHPEHHGAGRGLRHLPNARHVRRRDRRSPRDGRSATWLHTQDPDRPGRRHRRGNVGSSVRVSKPDDHHRHRPRRGCTPHGTVPRDSRHPPSPSQGHMAAGTSRARSTESRPGGRVVRPERTQPPTATRGRRGRCGSGARRRRPRTGHARRLQASARCPRCPSQPRRVRRGALPSRCSMSPHRQRLVPLRRPCCKVLASSQGEASATRSRRREVRVPRRRHEYGSRIHIAESCPSQSPETQGASPIGALQSRWHSSHENGVEKARSDLPQCSQYGMG